MVDDHTTQKPATATPEAAASEPEIILGELVKRWAPELRRTRCRGHAGLLREWIVRFKLWWERMTELEPFLRVKGSAGPDGVITVLVTDLLEDVRKAAAEHNTDYRQTLDSVMYRQLLISAEDVTRFCKQSGLPPPSFWPEPAAQPEPAPVRQPAPETVSADGAKDKARPPASKEALVKLLRDCGEVTEAKRLQLVTQHLAADQDFSWAWVVNPRTGRIRQRVWKEALATLRAEGLLLTPGRRPRGAP